MPLERNCELFLQRMGQKIRRLRNERQWTLEDTEEHGWPSWRHMQKLEAGKNITVATLWKVAKLYKVHPSKLLEEL